MDPTPNMQRERIDPLLPKFISQSRSEEDIRTFRLRVGLPFIVWPRLFPSSATTPHLGKENLNTNLKPHILESNPSKRVGGTTHIHNPRALGKPPTGNQQVCEKEWSEMVNAELGLETIDSL